MSITATAVSSRSGRRSGKYRLPPAAIETINSALRTQYSAYLNEPVPAEILALAERIGQSMPDSENAP